MCRILALHCINCVELEKAISLSLRALVDASRYDPYLVAVSSGRRESHDDGWGYALAIVRGNSVGIAYDRFCLPIFSSSSLEVIKQLEKFLRVRGEAKAIVHSRAASRGEPLGSRAAHPYEYRIEVGGEVATLFFAHNGGADKARLCRELSIPRHAYSDSYALGLFVARELERRGCIDEKCLAEIVALAVSTYCVSGDGRKMGGVTVSMLVTDERVHLVASSWFDAGDERRARYYQPYVARVGAGSSGLALFASSTVADRLHDLGLATEAKSVEAGSVIAIDAGASDGYRVLTRI